MTHKDIINLIENPESLNEDTLPAIRRLAEEYPYFQTARLLYTINLMAVKDAFFPSELKKSAFYAGDRKNLFYKLAGDRFANLRLPAEEPASLTDMFALIDSFLKETGEADSFFDAYSASAKEKDKTVLPLTSYHIENYDTGNTPTVALKRQDIIDRFLEADEKEPVRITRDKETPSEPDLIDEQKNDDNDSAPFFSETLAKIYIKQHKYEKAVEIIKKLSLLYPEKSIYFADQIRFLNKLITNAKKIT